VAAGLPRYSLLAGTARWIGQNKKARPAGGRAFSFAAQGLAVGGTLTADLLKTVRAVNRSVGARLERHPRFLSTIAASRAEHLTLPTVPASAASAATVAIATALRRPPCRPAARTSPGLIHETAGRIELLLAGRESKGLTAVAARKGLVCVAHADSSRNSWSGFASARVEGTCLRITGDSCAGLRTEPRQEYQIMVKAAICN